MKNNLYFTIKIKEKISTLLLFAILYFILAIFCIIVMFFCPLEPENFGDIFVGTCVSIWFSISHFIGASRQFKN